MYTFLKGNHHAGKVDKSLLRLRCSVDACPSEAIEMQDGKANVDPNSCVDCGVCVDECPVEAISME
jgi:Pyruvate/2-oxoacid:ferredoxin oxidoreductase delta subunit